MYWNILIIAKPEDYQTIKEYFYRVIPNRAANNILLPYIRISRNQVLINSGLCTIEIFPWYGEYRWRGYKAQLVYIPDELFEDLDTFALFRINAIEGTVRSVSDILRRISHEV